MSVAGLVARRALFWVLALLLGVFGLACLAFPLVMLGPWDPGAHLLDDTRAAYGGGRATEVFVTRVHCSPIEFGSSGRRGLHSVEYDCEFPLETPDHEPPAVEPDWAHMTYDEQVEFQRIEQERYSARLRELERGPGPNDPPSSLFRRLPGSAVGRPLPTLRQFTPDGTPPRYGLVWADGGLGWRWARWTWESLVFFGFGGLCFFAIPALRRKLR